MHYTWNYLPVPSSLATGDPGTYTYTVRIKGHKSIPIKKSWLSKTCFVFSSIFVLSPKMTPSWRWNDSSFACSPILIKYTSLFQSIKAGLASRSKLCVQCEYWNGATQKSIKEAIRTVGIESLRGWNPNRALDNDSPCHRRALSAWTWIRCCWSTLIGLELLMWEWINRINHQSFLEWDYISPSCLQGTNLPPCPFVSEKKAGEGRMGTWNREEHFQQETRRKGFTNRLIKLKLTTSNQLDQTSRSKEKRSTPNLEVHQ